MEHFNFADSYRAAGLKPGPDTIKLRQEPVEEYTSQIDSQIAVNLARIYFGLEVPGGTDWFRDIFSDSDPSFSMHDNMQEAAVLAACLLAAAVCDENVGAALAILTTSACGNRTPKVLPELVENARMALHTISVEARNHSSVGAISLDTPEEIEIDEDVDALIANPAWPEAGEILKNISNESNTASANLNQLQSKLNPLINQVQCLQEEVGLLWWHIGGWSRILEQPFSSLTPGLAAIMSGLDVADLSLSNEGPAAAPAMLHRTVVNFDDTPPSKTSITKAVETFPLTHFEKLKLDSVLKDIPDVCPVLTALQKFHEVGEAPAWEKLFERSTQLEASQEFDLTELATQVFRERSLLATFECG